MEQRVKTILLVEDEEKLRELVEGVLASNGFNVITACNGKDGLRKVQEENLKDIDLILTDVIMPQMSGKQMADLLKPILPHAKILFMSGYTDDALAPHGVLEQDIELIEKPFLVKNLVARIRELLT
jgi:two-component system cell cycle sensor histidine kinase/response regulator CckA